MLPGVTGELSVNVSFTTFDRGDRTHIDFIRVSALSCYSGEPYSAKEFPDGRAAAGIFNQDNFRNDYSCLINAGGNRAGFFLMGRAGAKAPWELGMLLIMPEYQNKGIGGTALNKMESFARKSDCPVILSSSYSQRSIVNGIPGFRADALHFFTNRGYVVQKKAEGAYLLGRENFKYNKEELNRKISANMSRGYQIKHVLADSDDYKVICMQAASLCEKEGKTGWMKIFSGPSTQKEYSGVTAILHNSKLVGFCAYGLAPSSSSVWGWGNQWGPLLVDSSSRSCGLGGWLIAGSLDVMFAQGIREVILWTTVGDMPSRIYEKYGFRLLCPFFSINKDMNLNCM
jgi:GNAT superfamily N-acetyltransferase